MAVDIVEVYWTKQAAEDRNYWLQRDRRIAKKIEDLIKAIRLDPFHGIGKPEPLRYDLAGYWSRRIMGAHRLVYRVEGKVLYIAQCRFHYAK